jgi:hypothetical protein
LAKKNKNWNSGQRMLLSSNKSSNLTEINTRISLYQFIRRKEKILSNSSSLSSTNILFFENKFLMIIQPLQEVEFGEIQTQEKKFLKFLAPTFSMK